MYTILTLPATHHHGGLGGHVDKTHSPIIPPHPPHPAGRRHARTCQAGRVWQELQLCGSLDDVRGGEGDGIQQLPAAEVEDVEEWGEPGGHLQHTAQIGVQAIGVSTGDTTNTQMAKAYSI